LDFTSISDIIYQKEFFLEHLPAATPVIALKGQMCFYSQKGGKELVNTTKRVFDFHPGDSDSHHHCGWKAAGNQVTAPGRCKARLTSRVSGKRNAVKGKQF
jgi:hypothetical protein